MWTGRRPSVFNLRVVGCKAFCKFNKTDRTKKFSAKAWIGEMVGYSLDTPGYRVWDPTTHKVWDVRALDFDESVSGGWWRKPANDKKPIWEAHEPLDFDFMVDPPVDPPMEQLGAIVPVPPAYVDVADGDDGEGPGDARPLDDVDEDDDDDHHR